MQTSTRAILSALLIVLLTGCATLAPKAARSEFEDIPVPKGLAYLDDESTIIESPSVKAAKLLYRGRVEPVSLGNAMRSTLEANGWRHVSTATAGDKGTTQVYEKPGNALQVRVWEGWYYTYIELTASRTMGSATSPTSTTSTK
jgi:hypothetical protein